MARRNCSIEEAQEWIKQNAPRYKILSWGGSSSAKSQFLDAEEDRICELNFTNFKIHIKENREIGTFRDTEHNCKSWLRKNKPRFELIEWGGSACSESKFLDTERNIQFSQPFRQLRHSIKRYGPGYIPRASKEEHQARLIELSKSRGQSFLIEGKTVREMAKEVGCSTSQIHKLLKSGLSSDEILSQEKHKTLIEREIELILIELGAKFEREYTSLKKYRPDFFIESKNLVIECDGLYWHSESVLQRNYHQKKKQFYNSCNLKSLFFREDEIFKKRDIVKSIISHHLGFDKKIWARSCELKVESKDIGSKFLEENHLMGDGSGKYYSLRFNDEIVAILQLKSKSKNENLFEVARFCTKNGISVTGGFSKLIKFAANQEKASKIITFIDKRYGSGEYLESLGWRFYGESLSFKWTNTKKIEKDKAFSLTFHRMKYPGSSGYDQGLVRIWDCGQAKWMIDFDARSS